MVQGRGRRGRGTLGKSNLSNGSGLLSQAHPPQRIHAKPAQHEPHWSGTAWQGQYIHGEGAHTHACGAEMITNAAWPPAFIPRRCRSQHSR